MALGKTVTYTPFQETSFGYGTAEIATAHSGVFGNATDIVKVTIEHASGNWDSTGHLSTPTVGTAVAVYHEDQFLWVCKGQRDDVDDVLDTLSFFPADKPQSRPYDATTNTSGFQTVALKANQTDGTFADEQPPAIGNTLFTVKVYNGASVVSTNTVTFDPTEPATGNQRPFFSVVPPTEDLNTTAHDTVAGGLVNFGTISHGSDTENVRVKCEFRYFGTGNTIQSSDYGVFTSDTAIFVGDKKPATRNIIDGRFDFTGSVAEAQAFLDNVRYYNAGNQQTFDMYLTISDGILGSEYTKTVYFSDATIGVSNIPDVHYIEDENPANWDFGNLSITNVQPDANSFVAKIDLDATGTSNTTGFTTATSVDTQTFSSGILTITENSLDTLKTALRNLRYVPAADFNSSFNMTVDFTFSNSTLGTSYTATQQTVAVTGQDVSEVANPTTAHTFVEDQVYNFADGIIPQITHGRNDDFDVVFTINSATQGVLARHGTNGFFRTATGGFKLSGSRDQVNLALQNLHFIPVADFDSNFTITFTVDRTTGDLSNQTQDSGSFTMTATALPDFTATAQTVNWVNNESKRYNTGIQITDTAASDPLLPAYNSTYTVLVQFKDAQGNAFTDAKVTSTQRQLLTSSNGLSNAYTITGTKDAVNTNLQDFKFIPDPFYTGTADFFIEYKITRDFDNAVIVAFSPSYRTTFTNPTINADFTLSTPLFNWTEDTVFDFDSTLAITEKVDENKNYTTANGYSANFFETTYVATLRSKYWDGSATQPFTGVTWSSTATASTTVNTTITGTGTVADPLVITGPKTEVNTVLANLRFTPNTADLTGSPASNGSFLLEASIQRTAGSGFLINFNPAISNFNAATDAPEYLASWTGMSYTEDIASQNIFANLSPILDGAGNLFDATYTAKIELDATNRGEFAPYVEDGYQVASYFTNFLIHFSGTKDEINTKIQNAEFTPVADGTQSVGIDYTQTRTIGSTTVTHANAVDVGDVTGVATPEFVYGTANQNKQYFVPEAFNAGVDTSQSDANILSGAANVTLTPKQISTNLGLAYNRPITITDTAADSGGPSLYKIVFSGGTLFTSDGGTATLSLMDTGYQTKADIHSQLDNGLHVLGIDTNITTLSLGTQRHANFTLHRRTYTGTETQIAQGTLTYEFRPSFQLWTAQPSGFTGSTFTGFTYTRIDNIADGGADVIIDTNFPDDQNQGAFEKRFQIRNNAGLNFTENYPFQSNATDVKVAFRNVTDSEDSTRHGSLDGRHEFASKDFQISQGRSNSGSNQGYEIVTPNYQSEFFDIEQLHYTASTEEMQLGVIVWSKDGVILKTGAPFTTGADPYKIIVRAT